MNIVKTRFTDDFIEQFIAALGKVEEKGDAKALVIHGLPDVFCAGADKKNLLALCDGAVHVKDLAVSRRLLEVTCPVIAAMEGHAVGGGLMLAVCCDMVIAARESRYGASFMELGFTPGMGCTRLLEELVGPYGRLRNDVYRRDYSKAANWRKRDELQRDRSTDRGHENCH